MHHLHNIMPCWILYHRDLHSNDYANMYRVQCWDVFCNEWPSNSMHQLHIQLQCRTVLDWRVHHNHHTQLLDMRCRNICIVSW